MTLVVDSCDAVAVTLLERIDAALAHAKATGRASSARDVATKAGLSPGYFGKTRIDLKKSPNADLGAQTLSRIAAVCGVRPEWLASNQGPMIERSLPTYEIPYDPQAQAISNLAESTTRYGTPPTDLERVIRGERPWWKPGMTPEQIAQVIAIAMTARGKVSQALPERYWYDFLVETADGVIRGEVKMAPTVDRSDDLGGGSGDLPRAKRRK